MKLGILGAGMIVREFLPWLTGPESPFKVEALCSTERSAGAAQALCDQYGVPRHTTSYDELLSWVDVVYIAVPNILHVKYTRAALEAGRHVIVEKPMAPTAALAEELAELARSKKLFLFEAVTTQYQDNYAKLKPWKAESRKHGKAAGTAALHLTATVWLMASWKSTRRKHLPFGRSSISM